MDRIPSGKHALPLSLEYQLRRINKYIYYEHFFATISSASNFITITTWFLLAYCY